MEVSLEVLIPLFEQLDALLVCSAVGEQPTIPTVALTFAIVSVLIFETSLDVLRVGETAIATLEI